MNQRDILDRHRKESVEAGMDERQQAVWNDAYSYGLIAILALNLFFFVSNYLLHRTVSYDLLPIFTGYITATNFYKYKKLHNKRYLFISMLGLFATIVGTAAFFLAAFNL